MQASGGTHSPPSDISAAAAGGVFIRGLAAAADLSRGSMAGLRVELLLVLVVLVLDLPRSVLMGSVRSWTLDDDDDDDSNPLDDGGGFESDEWNQGFVSLQG